MHARSAPCTAIATQELTTLGDTMGKRLAADCLLCTMRGASASCGSLGSPQPQVRSAARLRCRRRTLARILPCTLGSGMDSSVPVSSIMFLIVTDSLATSSSTSNVWVGARRARVRVSGACVHMLPLPHGRCRPACTYPGKECVCLCV